MQFATNLGNLKFTSSNEFILVKDKNIYEDDEPLQHPTDRVDRIDPVEFVKILRGLGLQPNKIVKNLMESLEITEEEAESYL